MNATTAKLHTRQDVCKLRRRGRTAQISDENSGAWPAPTMYRGRTPLWTTEEVEQALATEVETLKAMTHARRAEFQDFAQGGVKARRQKTEVSQQLAA